MSANGFAVIGAFLDLLRFGAAGLAVALGVNTLSSASRGRRSLTENRAYLSAILAYLLLGLALASWTSLYLLLDSCVAESPGAMCIYGVTRVGEGSPGVFGWLPTLVAGVQIMKPVLVFVAGAAVVLYGLYRRAGTQAMLPRFVAALLLLGLLSLADVAAETAYLLIPKREVPLDTGCCSVAGVEVDSSQVPTPVEERWLPPAYFVSQLFMAGLMGLPGPWKVSAPSILRLAGSLTASAVAAYVAVKFVIDQAAPALLHLPYHHCLYDLVGQIHESGVAIGLLIWGTFCVGWSFVAGCFGRTPDTLAFLATEIRRLQLWAALGYLGSAVMFGVDLWLA
jgi:hypothetical protein